MRTSIAIEESEKAHHRISIPIQQNIIDLSESKMFFLEPPDNHNQFTFKPIFSFHNFLYVDITHTLKMVSARRRNTFCQICSNKPWHPILIFINDHPSRETMRFLICSSFNFLSFSGNTSRWWAQLAHFSELNVNFFGKIASTR